MNNKQTAPLDSAERKTISNQRLLKQTVFFLLLVLCVRCSLSLPPDLRKNEIDKRTPEKEKKGGNTNKDAGNR